MNTNTNTNTKTKKIAGIVIVIILFIILITASRTNLQNERENSQGPIKIGASISLTGAGAQFGEMSQYAMEMAIEEINASGGMDGRMVELYIEDNATDPKDAVSTWRKLVDIDKVDAVIGGMFDFTTQPLLALSESEKITVISPINFVIDGSFEMTEHSFVMYPEFEKVIKELNTVIVKDDIGQMGMVRFQSDFGGEIERVLSGLLVENEKPALVVETYAEIGGSDFRTPILKLKEKGVDTVFLDMLDFDIVKFLNRADELDFHPRIIGYTTVRDVVGKTDLIEGAIMLDWEVPSDDFVKRFIGKYGFAPERGSSRSYAAIYVLAQAIANSDEQSQVASYIEKNTFNTIDGKVSFTESHAVASTPVKIMKVEGGKLVEVK